MARRLDTPVFVVYVIYLLAIAMTTALLVFWVLVVQRFTPEINNLLSTHLRVQWNHFHWFIQSTGAGLFFLVLVALTYLLAVSLSERRYSRKQAEFLSSMTHDLRTPLAAIRLHGQTLLEVDDLTADERRRAVGFILREAERVGGMVENLLEGSRAMAGKAEVELEPVSLPHFFEAYQAAVRGRFDLRQVDLRFEVRTRAVVMATTETLQRVMDNLIDNALRFTGKGGEIRCEVRDGGDGPEIVVADTGVGIPRRELERIFDRFYRLKREIGETRRGSGLGLAIVRSLVDEMGGDVRAVSDDGRPGARFEIRFPRSRRPSAAAEPAPEPSG